VTDFKQLTRDEFREAVFARDKHKCVVCGAPAKDAHHVYERKAWGLSGGYFLANGVSVCEEHHLEAEATTISCERLRELAGIGAFPLPEHLYPDQAYDKWLNPILPSGMRLRGELFDDVSVQKVLAPVLSLFTDRVKYPRTFHLPWSPGATSDDKVMKYLTGFETKGKEPPGVVVTLKLDGECTTMYRDYVHARSIEYDPHPSRSWVKALHARVAHDIPKGWRVCGENLYAKHSIEYQNLEGYFQVFSIWDERNVCLNWTQTKLYAELLGLQTVPVLYTGMWDEVLVRGLHKETFRGDPCEGYVARIYDEFHYRDFRRYVAKYVRKSHVTTHGHWMRSRLEINGLKEGAGHDPRA
jgi:hypothetical protein